MLSELIKAREKSNASTSLEYEIYFFDDAVVNSHSVLTTWVPSIKVEPVLEGKLSPSHRIHQDFV